MAQRDIHRNESRDSTATCVKCRCSPAVLSTLGGGASAEV